MLKADLKGRVMGMGGLRMGFILLDWGSPGLTGGKIKEILSQCFVYCGRCFGPIQVISRGVRTAMNGDKVLFPDMDKNPIALHEQ